jgi:hypothetical protein
VVDSILDVQAKNLDQGLNGSSVSRAKDTTATLFKGTFTATVPKHGVVMIRVK